MSDANTFEDLPPEEPGPDEDPATSLVGQTIAGRYRLDEKLGEGGMGAVYRAEHVLMHKTVAIKLLHREMTGLEDIVRRFAREAIAAGRIEHPNVASATDFGELEEGSYYLVLEYVPGRSLKDVVATDGSLPESRVLAIARQVAAALQAAHEVGIVHRDLKPDNVMLVDKGGMTDFVKVLDFGIAKMAAESDKGTKLTRVGAVFGTPQYMSPEQAQGKSVDGRADLYALGLIMHELSTGRRTFECAEMAGLLVKQMMEAPPALPSSVSSGTRALVGRLLEKDPDARPASAAEVVGELDALIGPISGGSVESSRLVPSASRRSSVDLSEDLSDRDLWHLVLQRIQGRLADARPVVERLWAKSRSVAQRRIAGRVPVWSVAGGAVLLLLAMSRLGPDASDERPEPASSAHVDEAPAVEAPPEEPDELEAPPPEPTDPELLGVIAAARRGSPAALYALSQRDAPERSVAEWMALAEGNLHRRKVEESLAAYAKALAYEPHRAEDKTMLTGLRYFAEKESTYEPVLEFAAEHMGAMGADLLFHVWASTSRKTPSTTRAFELLDTKRVRSHMTPALRVALDLRDAKTCEAIKAVLPRVLEVADERVLIRLRKLTEDSGCGPSGKDDCYPCLRGDDRLEAALVQIQMRNAPRIETTRRWR